MPEDRLVLVGEFGRAHGVKGAVRLKSFTAAPQAIAGYGALCASDGRPLTLTSVRPASGGAADVLIAEVAGVATRDAAERLNRVRVFVGRDQLPPPADADEFLLADLIGLTVEWPDGSRLGTVVGLPNYGGGDLLEIVPAAGGKSALLPFTRAFVPLVDIKAGRIVAAAPDDLFATARPHAEASKPIAGDPM